MDVARRNGVGSQRRIMGYYQEPENLDEIQDIVRMYADMGIESLFTWTYRGGHRTVLALSDEFSMAATLERLKRAEPLAEMAPRGPRFAEDLPKAFRRLERVVQQLLGLTETTDETNGKP